MFALRSRVLSGRVRDDALKAEARKAYCLMNRSFAQRPCVSLLPAFTNSKS
ncbi:hypothetical protein LMG22037_03584 [Paraburkholderia phenoliruptrix]|uniref:Uncharacterized protein n=1 Tax=Paraburkholderia phenoliruptrix TaxID=252970 RepID=A0A6J5BG64_9BURK|nr:hypothetical protein [Paraburkholderia phenoliruptrix]CAB3702528.1 hypothetical protein LMG22037_03584 [Paraburkholderia phenoliruptrix]